MTRAIDLGFSGLELLTKLAQAFPNALKRSLSALARIGGEQAESLREANAAGFTGLIRPPTGYRNADISSKYRYRFRVPYSSPGQRQQTTIVTVDSPTLLSPGQFAEAVNSILAQFSGQRLLNGYITVSQMQLSGPIVLISVERGAG